MVDAQRGRSESQPLTRAPVPARAVTNLGTWKRMDSDSFMGGPVCRVEVEYEDPPRMSTITGGARVSQLRGQAAGCRGFLRAVIRRQRPGGYQCAPYRHAPAQAPARMKRAGDKRRRKAIPRPGKGPPGRAGKRAGSAEGFPAQNTARTAGVIHHGAMPSILLRQNPRRQKESMYSADCPARKVITGRCQVPGCSPHTGSR